MQSLIIFASGKGSNAQAIIDFFRPNRDIKISLIISNNPSAGVLDIAAKESIPSLVINKQQFNDAGFVATLQEHDPALIILAGFLWKIPDAVVKAFPDNIINVHPALLPKYGGKGMYGHHVHNAVIDAGEAESGISIHYVNEVYDSGDIIVQARTQVTESDTADSLARKVHKLEHYFFPRTIDFLLKNQ
jgi:phosphoribosylglycinamide formyltransferase 1